MFKKKILLILFLGMFLISLASAIPPFATSDTTGYSIEPILDEYLTTGENYTFGVHVFNTSTGLPITEGITCNLHLYNETGNHQLELSDTTISMSFDYSFFIEGSNFSRGQYIAKFQCNNSDFGGAVEIEFFVNDYGLELKDAEQRMFNVGIIILFALLIMSIFGCFKIENYIAKFVFYWVSHLLVILITFSAWQFTEGYAIGYIGLAGFYKIFFYFFTIAVIPMIYLSIVWIVYIHLFNHHFEKMIEKGEDPETAFKLSKKKYGGWFYGKK